MKHLLEWFYNLAESYHVNPIIYGSIYFGAIPFFMASVAWLVRNFRRKKPVAIPLLCTGLTFTSAYIYLIVAGHNVPVWVYLFIGLMVLYGGYSTFKKVRKELTKSDGVSS